MVRSSAVEFLTFITARGEGDVNVVCADENVGLTQKMMAMLYGVGVPTVNYHLRKIFEDGETSAEAVIRNFRITAQDGKGYDTKHYNLKAIIAVQGRPLWEEEGGGTLGMTGFCKKVEKSACIVWGDVAILCPVFAPLRWQTTKKLIFGN